MKKPLDAQQLSRILFGFDPVNLAALGAPDDEYDGEAKMILSAINKDMTDLEIESEIKRIFIQNFDEEIVGKYDFQPLAREISQILEKERD